VPNPSHSGWTGIPWHFCDRCGFDYRVSELTRQNGILVCQSCFDDPSGFTRERDIQEVLSDGAVEGDVAEILKTPEDDDLFAM